MRDEQVILNRCFDGTQACSMHCTGAECNVIISGQNRMFYLPLKKMSSHAAYANVRLVLLSPLRHRKSPDAGGR